MPCPMLLSPEQLGEGIPVVLDLVQAHVTSQCLYAVLKLGVPNALGDSRRSAAELALVAEGSPRVDALLRCMRVLVGAGIFSETAREDGEAEFGLTPAGALLQMGVPQPSLACGVHHHAEKSMWAAWSLLPDFVAGKIDRSPFETSSGSPLQDYHKRTPESRAPFQEFMDTISSTELPAVIEEVDWRSMYGKTVVDAGAGSGFVMGVVADHFPKVKCVAFDRPEVIAAAGDPPAGVTFTTGDIFDASTLPQGDAFFLKHVLHNWDDEKAASILRSCASVLPSGGRIVVGEAVLPPAGEASTSSRTPFLFDALKMLSGGRERTRSDWEALAAAAGLELLEVKDTGCPTCHIITLGKP